MRENLFLCCYCGEMFKKNIAFLKRHEVLHKKIVKRIQCASENCIVTFQNKANYHAHWSYKHSNQVMPNVLNFVQEKSKYKNKIKKTATKTTKKISVNSVEAAVEFKLNVKIEECLMRDPFFGEIKYMQDEEFPCQLELNCIKYKRK